MDVLIPSESCMPTEIERHRSALSRYIRRLVRDPADAEDLTQETPVRAHRQCGTLRDPAALTSWLYQIATHVSVDRLRQRMRTIQRQVDAPVESWRLLTKIGHRH